MTDPVSGSSLLQARDVHSSHSKHHNHIRSHHNHESLHRRQDDNSSDSAGDDSSSSSTSASSSDSTSDSTSSSGSTSDSNASETIVQVVQTVSVVQLVDASGALVGTTTQTSEPSTTQITVEATFGIESDPDVSTSSTDDVTGVTVTSVSPATASSVDTASPAETASSSDTSSTSPSSSMTSSFPTVETFASITSSSSSGSTTAFPSFTGVTNSTTTGTTTSAITSSLISSNGTFSAEAFTANLTTSTLPNSSGTILYNDTFTTTVGLTSTSSSSFASLTGTVTSTGTVDGGSVTGTGFGGVGSGGTATGDSSAASSTSTTSSGSGSSSGLSSTQAGTVAGSVLGAVAGIGLIFIAAMFLLRYKKRQRGLRLSDDHGLPGTRGLVLGGGGPSHQPHGMDEMSQPRSIPFAVPAALANLTGYKRYSQRTIASSEGTERGFQKVSGRKLPSVLQHGGDGYTDPTNPRDTMLTEGSYYRDSQGSFSGPSMPRLAVGSPMRPESGIPVFHAGPARIPVTESGYFASNTNLGPPRRDPLGRSLASQDGSRRSQASGSRFTEEITPP